MASPSPAETAAPATRQLLGLLALSCATLLLQTAWTRVLSVSLWYHFAFLVVSTALLGFGLSGVLLTLSRRLGALDLDRGLPWLALLYAAATLGGFWLANRIPFAPFSLLGEPLQLLLTPLYLLCIAAPFVLSGLCAAILLARRPAHAGRIYFFDLVGAGLGCLLLLAVMPVCGGSGTIVACAALACLGALGFAPAGRARALPLLAALALAALAPSPFAERLFPIRISAAKTVGGGPSIDRELAGPTNLFTGWNTSSRIDVLPASWGRRILIDAGTAMTRMPRITGGLGALPPLEDERALALADGTRPAASVLVIGSGGGWDVLAALRAGARRVVAVEINPLINELVEQRMAAFVGGLFSDPRVQLVTAEARSFIRRSGEAYDAILASHTISNAATASGALSLAEDYVMTREAFVDYLGRLSPRGRLWFTRPEAQLPRLTATAREALAALGVEDAASRMVIFAGRGAPSFYGGLLVSRAPLDAPERARAASLLGGARLRVLHLPGTTSVAPYAELLTAHRAALPQLYRASPTQLAPASDDRPFFNQRARWSELGWSTLRRVFDQGGRTRMALEDQPVAEAVLALVLLQSGVLALLLIVIPLAVRLRGVERRRLRLLLYFLCLGLGFILCEIALIQRFTLFLGQPIHTFAVVVGTLLVSSGVGSLLSARLFRGEERLRRRVTLLLVAIALVVFAVATLGPRLLHLALGLPLGLRVLCAALLIAPLGVLLGMPFPAVLGHTGRVAPGTIPWAWGLNAVASVVGSVAAMVLATVVGFGGVLLLAGGVYLAAALCDPARD